MPIEGRSAEECFDRFRAHVSQLVKATIPGDWAILVLKREGGHCLSCYRGDPTTIPLDTNHGELHFYLGQNLQAVEKPRRHFRLKTLAYWYRLQATPGLTEHALLRWEYRADFRPDGPGPCRNHLQVRVRLEPLGLDINKAHVPTGWVTIEEVIRFLIVELGVKPPCGDDWPGKLAAGERAFYHDFASWQDEP